MKRKKADDDFIDISSRNALTFFNQPPSKKKVTEFRILFSPKIISCYFVAVTFSQLLFLIKIEYKFIEGGRGYKIC